MDDNPNKPLTPDEIAKLLGADEYEYIGDISMDPISLLGFAHAIGQRMQSQGGRPTDRSWEISRKIPMKKETWAKLEELSDALGEQKVRVAAGQLAAIALERGLPLLAEEYNATSMRKKNGDTEKKNA